jgi:hypothetical protein
MAAALADWNHDAPYPGAAPGRTRPGRPPTRNIILISEAVASGWNLLTLPSRLFQITSNALKSARHDRSRTGGWGCPEQLKTLSRPGGMAALSFI